MVLAGLSGFGLALAPSSALANGSCDLDPNGNASARHTLANLPAGLAQEVCDILTMPTASRSEGERFLEQIEPGSLLTHTSASPEAMTLPSLWWNRDSIPPLLGRHRLVDAWVSYTIQESGVRVVDVTINNQFWRALSMPQRYGVLAAFGTSAQDFGYHLRFFQSNGYSARAIGLYACDAQPTAGAAHCLITVEVPRIVQLRQSVRPQPSIQTATSPAVAPTAVAEAAPVAQGITPGAGEI